MSDVYKAFNKSQNMCAVMIRSACVVHEGEVLRFLTLTTAPNMIRSLNKAWHILITDIKRLTITKLLKDGYLNDGQIGYFYGDKPLDESMICQYLAVETTEGYCGVYHVLMYGDFLPHQWLKDRWLSITGTARSLKIEYVGSDKKFKDNVNLSTYVVSHYVSGQHKFKRYLCSRDFTFIGFADRWRLHKRLCDMSDLKIRNKAYKRWNLLLTRYALYGEWALYRGLTVAKMKEYCELYGRKIVGI